MLEEERRTMSFAPQVVHAKVAGRPPSRIFPACHQLQRCFPCSQGEGGLRAVLARLSILPCQLALNLVVSCIRITCNAAAAV